MPIIDSSKEWYREFVNTSEDIIEQIVKSRRYETGMTKSIIPRPGSNKSQNDILTHEDYNVFYNLAYEEYQRRKRLPGFNYNQLCSVSDILQEKYGINESMIGGPFPYLFDNKESNMVVGPFPAPKRPPDIRYSPSEIETMPLRQDWARSIEREVERKIRENEQKAREEKQLQYLIENPIDFNSVLCELIKLQKEFIETQIKYKAFPIYPNSNVIEMPKQISIKEKYGVETVQMYSVPVQKIIGIKRKMM